ncbi:hypothetical protein EM308_11490 [Flavobacterium gilvum]|uniref:Uncharacterized protein n=1 Tax=Flavobacterium gilvum TaxID=1492737 RepID=A0AAC9I8I0_9FLAO|nr:hypothetical protein EM308_11490 [Flavobacterium gilvum]
MSVVGILLTSKQSRFFSQRRKGAKAKPISWRSGDAKQENGRRITRRHIVIYLYGRIPSIVSLEIHAKTDFILDNSLLYILWCRLSAFPLMKTHPLALMGMESLEEINLFFLDRQSDQRKLLTGR